MSSFSIEFSAPIWKLLPDTTHNKLVIEIRAAATQYADFATICATTGEIGCNGIDDISDSWWAGLDAAGNGVFVLYQYADKHNPIKKGIYVYDTQQGNLLWANENAIFQAFEGEMMRIATWNNTAETQIVNPNNGLPIEKAIINEKNEKLVAYPYLFHEQNPHFGDLKEFIAQKTKHHAVESVEYYETKKNIIISYHIVQNATFANYLLIADVQGNVLRTQQLSNNLKGIAYNTFFLLNNCTIFVANKKEIHCYPLESTT